MQQQRILISSLISLSLVFSLTGCSSLVSSKMPQGSISMQQAYSEALNGNNSGDGGSSDASLSHLRAKVQSKGIKKTNYTDYTRTQKNEINSQFQRLPNPNVVMYIYPHLAGTGNEQVPVPGYSTVFSLYQGAHYLALS